MQFFYRDPKLKTQLHWFVGEFRDFRLNPSLLPSAAFLLLEFSCNQEMNPLCLIFHPTIWEESSAQLTAT